MIVYVCLDVCIHTNIILPKIHYLLQHTLSYIAIFTYTQYTYIYTVYTIQMYI